MPWWYSCLQHRPSTATSLVQIQPGTFVHVIPHFSAVKLLMKAWKSISQNKWFTVGLPLKWASIVTSIYKYLIIHFNEAQATCELNNVFPVLMWICSVLWQIRGSHLTFVQLGPVNVLGQPADTGMYCVFLYPTSVVISLISTILNCFPTSLFLNHILS